MPAEIIEAPNEYAGTEPSLFLAGGITGTVDWQTEIARQLVDVPIVLLNPRRRHFPMNDPTVAEAQIHWEYRYLRSATAVLFWFPHETLCPIALYELGSRSMVPGQPLFVGTHPEYARRIDVVIQMKLARPDVVIFGDLDELADRVREWATQIRKRT